MLQNSIRLRRLSLSNVPAWLILLIILSVMAVIIWGTLGLKTTAVYEDWQVYNAFSKGLGPFDFTALAQPDRPLMEACSWIGYAITPDSFVGLNIYNVVLFIVQGLLVLAIVRQLWPENTVFALAVALLCLVYPADNSLGNNRYTGYHTSVVCFLLSVLFLIRYWRFGGLINLSGMIVASALNLGIVESSYPLVFLIPLLLLKLEPGHRFTPRIARATVGWAVAPIVLLLNTLIIAASGGSAYVDATLSQPLPIGTHLINFSQSLVRAYVRVLFEGWRLAFSQLDIQSFRVVAGMIVAIVISILLWLPYRKLKVKTAKVSAMPSSTGRLSITCERRDVITRYRTWFGLGLLIIGFGFAPFAYFSSHENLTERTYYLSDLGGALVIVVMLSWIGNRVGRPALVVALGSALLLGIALQADLVDVLRSKTASVQEQYLLEQVANQVPNPGRAETLVIFDATHQLTKSVLFAQYPFPNSIEPAFQYFYNDPGLKVRICDIDAYFAVFPADICSLTTQAIHWDASIGIPEMTTPISKVIAFTYDGESRLRLLKTWPVANATSYDPIRLIDTLATSNRAVSIFGQASVSMQIPFNEHPSRSVYFDNTSLIYFNDAQLPPLVSYGWYSNQVISPRGTLDVWLSADRDYQLKVVINHSTLVETLKHITLTVNDQPISLTAQTNVDQGLTLTGTIPRDVVARDLTRTRITFLSYPLTTPLAAGTGTDSHYLGFQVDQFSVTPVTVPAS